MKIPNRLKTGVKKIVTYGKRFDEVFYAAPGEYPSSNLCVKLLSAVVDVSTADPNILKEV
ncbi:MAG: hypothetical protein LBP35_02170 [Candidatus Ancillula trichonymphae]|nr:hypothetical protein [Candidatus Ancillula trichonymphae]